MNRWLLFAALLGVAACATPLRPPPGLSEQQIKRDRFECTVAAREYAAPIHWTDPRGATFVLDYGGPRTNRRLYRMCLESRGYEGE